MIKSSICTIGNIIFKEKTPNLNQVKRIALIKSGAIGDVLMTTPFLRILKQRFPTAQIDYWVGKPSSTVLQKNPNINNMIKFDPNIMYKKKIFQLIKLARTIRNQKYDLIFPLDFSWHSGLFARICKSSIIIGFDRLGEGFANTVRVPFGKKVKHHIDYYLDLAYAVGIEKTKNKQIDLFLSKEDELLAKKTLRNIYTQGKLIAIIPGGAKNIGIGDDSIRRWPIEKFTQLIKELQKNNTIILIGGPADKEIHNRILLTLYNAKNVFDFARKTNIQQSAALMKYCNYVICCDSGPMHIASAVNKNIISLFGPSNPLRKAPLHKESIAIWKDVNIYEDSYEIYGTQPKSKEFMKDIRVEDVLKLIK